MKYLSVCSGIEAASVAWGPLGWEAVAFSEIEKYPSAVLAAHYPNVPNWGDMTRFEEWPNATIDVLVGGTPCQSFSVAGLRRGLADPRGNLALTYLAIADRYRPQWLVWENVPGVLSADEGRAFGALLGGMEQLGYGWAYRTLDAQYFGVAQRRRRVFVVGCLGGWASAASVLFEPESLRGDPAPRRKTGQVATRDVEASTGSVAHCLNAGGMGRQDYETETLITQCNATHALTAEGFDANEDGTGRGTPIIGFNGRQGAVPGHVVGALDADSHTQFVAFSCKDYGADVSDIAPTLRAMGHNGSHANAGGQLAVAFNECQSGVYETAMHPTLDANKGSRRMEGVRQGMSVRRLTPTECERLQGFPDGYTRIQYRGKPAPDGPRYKALGNSMAVPVMAWIGRRMDAVDCEALS